MACRSVGWVGRARAPSLVLASVVSVALGCGGEGDDRDPFVPAASAGSAGDDGGGDPACAGSNVPDDLVIDAGARADTVEPPAHVAAVGPSFVVCGEGFVAGFHDGELSAAIALAGRCAGVAAIDDARAAVAIGSEVHLVSVAGGAPTAVASRALPGAASAIASDGTRLYVATASAEIAVLEVDESALAPGPTIASGSALDLAWTPAGLLVAAGEAGVRLLGSDGAPIAELVTSSPALGVRAEGSRAAILRGGFGWDLVEVDDVSLRVVRSRETEGVVLDAAIAGDEVLTVDAHAIVRHDADGEIVSVEPRPHAGALMGEWLRGIAVAGEHALVLDDAGVLPMAIADAAPRPRLRLDVPALALRTEPGQPADALLVVQNAGTGPMILRAVEAEAPLSAHADVTGLDESDECPGQHVVPPGASVPVEIRLQAADDEPSTTAISVLTDDPDAPAHDVPVDTNRPSPAIGEPAEDFSLPTLDGGTFRLSDHRGSVVVLKLFNFACSTCAEELPEIEAELLPAYPAGDVVIVGINTGRRTSYAADLAREADLSLPIALDLDSEVFRRLRIPGKVFPLHVVIDRDGDVAWVSNEKGVAPIRAAIDAIR